MARVNIGTILCPIDFSEFSRDALDHALALARWYHAEVVVLHVVETPPPLPPPGEPGGFVLPPPAPDLDEDVRQFVGSAIGGAGDVRLTVRVTSGNPSVAIDAFATRLRADLLVLGTHGRSGFRRFLLGSVTERIMRTTPVPALVVPPPVRKPETILYETILCPIDFSPESMQALHYALSLAQESGGRIVLLHVLEGLLDEVDPKEFPDVNLPEYFASVERDASLRLAAAIPAEARDWARPVERVARGRASRQILDTAKKEGAALIVMGVRGKGAVERLLFGSTTEFVIRDAVCPVLTVHANAPSVRRTPAPHR